MTTRTLKLVCVVLLVYLCAWRLYRLDAPVVDGFWDKQIVVANKSRNMAGPPLNLVTGALDFLPEDGEARPFAEEIPLYYAVVALGYRAFGEQDWFARLFSGLGSLVAIGAFYALVKRELDEARAWVAVVFLAACPLWVYYGRAVLPDPWMIAGILLACACQRRYLDDPRPRWLLAAGAAGLLAASFKYYGLMALVPMWEMTLRLRGRQALRSAAFWLPAAMMILPVALWIMLVFVQSDNPAQSFTYFIFQRPELLLTRGFWTRLFDQVLWKDSGPIVMGMFIVGFAAAWRQGVPRVTAVWSAAGLGFYILLGPKAWDHEYYNLMMLPGIALWATAGWMALWSAVRAWPLPVWSKPWHGLVLLAIAAVVQSPVVMHRSFDQENGFVRAGQRLKSLCSPTGRVVVGPRLPQPIVHYAQRQGWLWQSAAWPEWREALARYEQLGAEYVLIYFDGRSDAEQRDHYRELLDTLPVVEHESGPWGKRGRPCEYYILRLKGADLAHHVPTRNADAGLVR